MLPTSGLRRFGLDSSISTCKTASGLAPSFSSNHHNKACWAQPRSNKAARRQLHSTVVASVAAVPSKLAEAGSGGSTELALAVLEQAAEKRNVPAPQVVKALTALEKARLPSEGWSQELGSGPTGGSRWRLIFNANGEQIKAVNKGENPIIAGFYCPVPAVQRWDESQRENENGIFLGHIAAFTFRGSYEWKKKLVTFKYEKLRLRLGPKWFEFNITPKDKSKPPPTGTFSFLAVNDKICAARGKSGGFALWAKTNPKWIATAGAT